MAIREGAWDCPACGRKRNRGPEKFCGGCGRPRGPEVKFYLPEDSPEVTDAAALARAAAGPDWSCPYCDADNPATHTFCSGCGAPRDGAAVREVVEHRGAGPVAPPPSLQAQALAQAAPPAAKGSVGSWLKKGCGIGCLGLLVLTSLIVFLGRPQDADLTVTGHRWERAVELEAQKRVTEQAWQDKVPAGVLIVGSRREIHHYDKVQTGTERKTRTVTDSEYAGTERVQVGTRDLGNGYFEDVYEDRPIYRDVSREETYDEPVYREDPVYRQRILYEVDRWVPVRTERVAGENLASAWPPLTLAGTEREKQRTEKYQVLFKDEDGKTYVYEAPTEAAWRAFEPGRVYKAKVSGGKIVEIEGPGGGSRPKSLPPQGRVSRRAGRFSTA